MPVVKFTLNQESFDELQRLANQNKQSVPDYVRSKLFGKTIFTVEEAIKRIKLGDFDNTEKYPEGFELPDVFGDDWTISRGPAGAFGKSFYNYVIDNPDLGIKFKDMGKYGRRAVYTFERR